MTAHLDVILITFMAAVAVAVARLRDLFAAAMLLGMFSLLSAAAMTVMDAVDVAFTEASVGAGISTILMLGTLALTSSKEAPGRPRRTTFALLAALATGVLLVYGTLDMPHYGDPAAPIHNHVAPHYIEQSWEEIGIPNVVTSVLASYRGYDTFGETTVIFAAAVGVLLLLGGGHISRRISVLRVPSAEEPGAASGAGQLGEASGAGQLGEASGAGQLGEASGAGEENEA